MLAERVSSSASPPDPRPPAAAAASIAAEVASPNPALGTVSIRSKGRGPRVAAGSAPTQMAAQMAATASSNVVAACGTHRARETSFRPIAISEAGELLPMVAR